MAQRVGREDEAGLVLAIVVRQTTSVSPQRLHLSAALRPRAAWPSGSGRPPARIGACDRRRSRARRTPHGYPKAISIRSPVSPSGEAILRWNDASSGLKTREYPFDSRPVGEERDDPAPETALPYRPHYPPCCRGSTLFAFLYVSDAGTKIDARHSLTREIGSLQVERPDETSDAMDTSRSSLADQHRAS